MTLTLKCIRITFTYYCIGILQVETLVCRYTNLYGHNEHCRSVPRGT